MSVITPQPILRHLLDRLYQNYVPDTLYPAADVLVMMNDAYLEACERSMCLRDLVTFTLVADQQEYTLPSDYSQAVHVVMSGVELYPLPLSTSLVPGQRQAGYYTYANKIGFTPAPIGDTASATPYLLYAAKPAPLASFDDTLDPRYPVEYADILLHYVRWRTLLMSGGAEQITGAGTDRSISSARISELRRSVDTTEHANPTNFQHVLRRRRRLMV